MLTGRQLEIARLVAEGKSAKCIAREVGISRYTAEAHIRDAASRIPGKGPPRWKLVLFILADHIARST